MNIINAGLVILAPLFSFIGHYMPNDMEHPLLYPVAFMGALFVGLIVGAVAGSLLRRLFGHGLFRAIFVILGIGYAAYGAILAFIAMDTAAVAGPFMLMTFTIAFVLALGEKPQAKKAADEKPAAVEPKTVKPQEPAAPAATPAADATPAPAATPAADATPAPAATPAADATPAPAATTPPADKPADEPPKG